MFRVLVLNDDLVENASLFGWEYREMRDASQPLWPSAAIGALCGAWLGWNRRGKRITDELAPNNPPNVGDGTT